MPEYTPISWLKPKNDFVFKLIFGSDNKRSRELLLAFLNDALNVPEGPSFESVEILNPFFIQQNVTDKYAILDIKARVFGYGY
ncbi:PD-(D/E)XK nuclease family transposase [Oceanobacillus salinisoli]|uniref:PD-(D/E)XK nuclease family transposase n=1 Tax=Oceanobacillus salinisoli TaxID=2678611 RepID=UPI0012E1CFB2|nr:PD-(D/E)XK nuclease family transposase [Oceanobacillus salinisoli]